MVRGSDCAVCVLHSGVLGDRMDNLSSLDSPDALVGCEDRSLDLGNFRNHLADPLAHTKAVASQGGVVRV